MEKRAARVRAARLPRAADICEKLAIGLMLAGIAGYFATTDGGVARMALGALLSLPLFVATLILPGMAEVRRSEHE